MFIKVQNPEEKLHEAVSETKSIGKVIREGELTGHLHEVLEEEAQLVDKSTVNGYYLDMPLGDMILTSKNPISIAHPEHNTLKLPKGMYVVRIQREYDEVGDRQIMD